jgi:Cu+-exporting ATPase
MPPTSTKLRDPYREMATTTCFISNLHCPSCIDAIKASLSALDPKPEDIFVSIVSHSVVVRHAAFLAIDDISSSLEAAGFEIHSIFQDKNADSDPVEVRNPKEESKEWHTSLERAVSLWGKPDNPQNPDGDMHKRELHVKQCEQCKSECGGINLESTSDDGLHYKSNAIITTSPKASYDGAASLDQKSPISEKFIFDEPTTIQSDLGDYGDDMFVLHIFYHACSRATACCSIDQRQSVDTHWHSHIQWKAQLR